MIVFTYVYVCMYKRDRERQTGKDRRDTEGVIFLKQIVIQGMKVLKNFIP